MMAAYEKASEALARSEAEVEIPNEEISVKTVTHTPTKVNLRDFITVRDRTARTTSLKVAEAFGKEHRDVLRAIKGLECSEDLVTAQFCAMTREVATGSHGGVRKFPYYEMTKDGFVFLVMGFTGVKAAAIKEAYIAAFNWMADQLERKGQGIWDTTIGTDGAHVLGELLGKKVKHLPRALQHSARMTLWSRLHTRFNVARAELIPANQMDAAANFIAAYVYEGEIHTKVGTESSDVGADMLYDSAEYRNHAWKKFQDYLGAVRQSLNEAGAQMPPSLETSSTLLDGFITEMLWSQRWILSFDRVCEPKVTPLPNTARMVDPRNIGQVQTLLLESVPIEALPEIIHGSIRRLEYHARRKPW